MMVMMMRRTSVATHKHTTKMGLGGNRSQRWVNCPSWVVGGKKMLGNEMVPEFVLKRCGYWIPTQDVGGLKNIKVLLKDFLFL